MTTGSDGRHVQPHCARQRSKTYHPWKFGDSISYSFWEKGWTWKYGNRPYLATGSENRKIEKIEFASFHNTSTLKISRKSIQPSLRNRPDKKGGKIRIIGITKNKQSTNYKVFRLKRKTLKRIIIIIRNRVKTICSQTSFGEHNQKWSEGTELHVGTLSILDECWMRWIFFLYFLAIASPCI